jgi:hypothetical protein
LSHPKFCNAKFVFVQKNIAIKAGIAGVYVFNQKECEKILVFDLTLACFMQIMYSEQDAGWKNKILMPVFLETATVLRSLSEVR